MSDGELLWGVEVVQLVLSGLLSVMLLRKVQTKRKNITITIFIE